MGRIESASCRPRGWATPLGARSRQLPLWQQGPTTPKPSHRCPVAPSEWSLIMARLGRLIAPSRWLGVERAGRRMVAATESRLVRATSCAGRGRRHGRLASRRVVSAGRRGADTPGCRATRPRRPRVRSGLRSRPRRPAAPRPEGAPGALSASLSYCHALSVAAQRTK
jgi:hypothetical protein